MERHFALPIAFAAAAHGALLFGIPHSSSPRPLASVERLIFELRTLPPDDDPVTITPEYRSTEHLESPPPSTHPTFNPIDSPKVTTTALPTLDPITAIDTQITIPTAPERPGGNGLPGFAPGDILGTDLDSAPRTRLQPAPIYPYDAKRQGLTGEVFVEFVVDESGHVHDPRVVKSSNRVFEEAAMRAISRWQFEPGRRFGRVVKFRMIVPMVFLLNE